MLSLSYTTIQTPLGEMLAIADEKALHYLEFLNEESPDILVKKISQKNGLQIMAGNSQPLTSIQTELKSYFEGKLKNFKTPLHLSGTEFQTSVWKALLKIPYGKTRSYQEQSEILGKKSAYRAVANANGANKISIVIPCHRVINSNGKLGGYSGGLSKKEWLLNHEKQFN